MGAHAISYNRAHAEPTCGRIFYCIVASAPSVRIRPEGDERLLVAWCMIRTNLRGRQSATFTIKIGQYRDIIFYDSTTASELSYDDGAPFRALCYPEPGDPASIRLRQLHPISCFDLVSDEPFVPFHEDICSIPRRE